MASFSSIRKKALCGWLLKENNPNHVVFDSPIKLQKYLFFYEMMSKVENKGCELRKLKGYKNGPVFSDVYGDRKNDPDTLIAESKSAYDSQEVDIDENLATIASFLTRIMTVTELSEFSHVFDIWKSKENEIKKGVQQVPLCDMDISDNDMSVLQTLMSMYPVDFISDIFVKRVKSKIFLLRSEDCKKLTPKIESTFRLLANHKDLINPVYVSVSENGVLLID